MDGVMPSWMLRLQAWLRREEYVKAAVEEAAKRAFLQGHADGYQIGRAQGELQGRQDLARELEIAYGADGRDDLTGEDVKRIRAAQLH